jgi:hypothetical protein
VSASYFDVLGVGASLGRTFQPGDDTAGHDHIVILSHAFWASRFNSDATLVGRAIHLDNEPYTVVGILPADSPFDRAFTRLWVPLTFTPANTGNAHSPRPPGLRRLLDEIFNAWESARPTMQLLRRGHSAQLQNGLAASFIPRQPTPLVMLRQQIDVCGERPRPPADRLA